MVQQNVINVRTQAKNSLALIQPPPPLGNVSITSEKKFYKKFWLRFDPNCPLDNIPKKQTFSGMVSLMSIWSPSGRRLLLKTIFFSQTFLTIKLTCFIETKKSVLSEKFKKNHFGGFCIIMQLTIYSWKKLLPHEEEKNIEARRYTQIIWSSFVILLVSTWWVPSCTKKSTRNTFCLFVIGWYWLLWKKNSIYF